MTTENSLRSFIIEELHFAGDPAQLTSDYPLLETDTIDSLGIYSIIGFCEDEFGVHIDDDELVPENFETIGDIAGLVRSKQNT
jgi:acyl carrier protein